MMNSRMRRPMMSLEQQFEKEKGQDSSLRKWISKKCHQGERLKNTGPRTKTAGKDRRQQKGKEEKEGKQEEQRGMKGKDKKRKVRIKNNKGDQKLKNKPIYS